MPGMGKFKQRGQTLVLFLGFVAAMTGMMLIVFNSGQVTNAKMRAMNAADAAAYSGAVWEARSLNFQAYMNRAMVVNEVTIAQSVSLRSWVSYVDRFVTNVNTITKYIPYVGAATSAIQRVIKATDQSAQNLLPPFDMILRSVNSVEHAAQIGFNASGSVIAQDLARNMARENGAVMSSGGDALMLLNLAKWTAFTNTYEGNNRARVRDVTLDSRDGFSQARDKYFKEPTGVIFEIRKQGGTDLINYDTWKGLDSSELRTAKVLGKWRGKVPMAWGGAQDFGTRRQTGIGRHGEINEWNTTDGQWARSEANSTAKAKRLGIPFQGYRDIANPKLKNMNLQVPFSVEVVIEGSNIATANSAFKAKSQLINGTQIEHDPDYAAGRGIYAMAESCVRFARPYRQGRADNAKEFPSLFNPYWTPSLATESKAARILVDGVKKLPPPLSTFFGTDTCA
jgi:hypothetical protein